jgi:hypothetical protein
MMADFIMATTYSLLESNAAVALPYYSSCYRIIPKEKINIGIDVGFGKDDHSITVRIGESFLR